MQNLAIRGGYLMTSDEVMLEFQRPWLLFEPRSFHLPRSADIGPAVCLESGALVSKSFVGTDRRVYLTTAGSLVAKAAAAGAGEKLVKMVNGRLLAG